jgi:hypothetical protein
VTVSSTQLANHAALRVWPHEYIVVLVPLFPLLLPRKDAAEQGTQPVPCLRAHPIALGSGVSGGGEGRRPTGGVSAGLVCYH